MRIVPNKIFNLKSSLQLWILKANVKTTVRQREKKLYWKLHGKKEQSMGEYLCVHWNGDDWAAARKRLFYRVPRVL